MMNMNKATTNFTIYLFEIHTTDCTFTSMNGYTLFSSFSITLIAIDYNFLFRSFKNRFRIGNLVIVRNTLILEKR